MATDQRQGDRNPEFMEPGPSRSIGGDPQQPTQPSSPLSAEAQAGMERFGRPTSPDDTYTRGPSDLPPGENPASDSPGGSTYNDPDEAPPKGSQEQFHLDEAWLIAKAHELYTTSTDYLDANITNTWERTLSHFINEHAPSTNFRRRDWKRSRVFRPKTRSMTKSAEAALTVAAFSTQDVLAIEPEDPRNEAQRVSAAVNKEILQYRMDRRMPWYMTVIGAFQSTKVYGLCISYNYWKYQADTDIVPAFDDNNDLITDENGTPMGYEELRVRHDELCCDNVAPENFRFDPMCDWRDPVKTSPYLVYMMPVYAGDALEMMETVDPKTGQPMWRRHSLGSILATRRKNYDRTRQAREGRERIDPADEQHGNAYTMLWAHMNISKINGEDYMWWTMGTELLLTNPVRIADAYPHLDKGDRPFTVGFSTIEAFRNYPAGDVEQMMGLQEEINIVANQRLDNVKLVLNKRYYVRRGAQVDLDALVRNVPGGGVMMNDPEKDVQTINTPDVTASSYQEQDRLAVEADELVGNFSQGSVQTNRNLNETVGGLNMMNQTAGSIQDYGLRVFFETWMEPTIRQLLQLVQMYETDEVILSLAANRSQLWQRYGLNFPTDELLRQGLTTRINVGMGMTDPIRRVERLIFGVQTASQLPGQAERMKSNEITNEIFGSIGYKDGSRFFKSDEEIETEAAENPPPPDPAMMDIQLRERELAIRENDNQLRHQRELMRLEMDAQVEFTKIAVEKQLTLEQLYARMGTDEAKLRATRDQVALKESNRIIELADRRQQQNAQPQVPAAGGAQ